MVRMGRPAKPLAALLIAGCLAFSTSAAMAQAQSSGAPPEGKSQARVPVKPADADASATDTKRWVIPYVTSVTKAAGGGSRAFTAVAVMNLGAKDCAVTVNFEKADATWALCSATSIIPAGTSVIFCSRSVRDPVMPCNSVCNPELSFYTGHAYVSSNSASCAKMAVHAEVINTQDQADTIVQARTPLTVAPLAGAGN
jgi:hypothetical protein